MSRIRANTITNKAATGAPTFSNGAVVTGVCTATSFSGSGANLTSLPAGQLTGALPAISGANLTGISATYFRVMPSLLMKKQITHMVVAYLMLITLQEN